MTGISDLEGRVGMTGDSNHKSEASPAMDRKKNPAETIGAHNMG
jgi:hypothetical protein